MADEHVWYFAYGSNMSPGTFLERRQMRPLETTMGWVDGYRLCFDIPIGPGERGVANLQVDERMRTHGVAYLLTRADAERLDGTEGVPSGFYYREPVAVQLGDGRTVTGFTYRSTISDLTRKPSARYLGLLLDGARVHGLHADYVAYLEAFVLAVDERTPEKV